VKDFFIEKLQLSIKSVSVNKSASRVKYGIASRERNEFLKEDLIYGRCGISVKRKNGLESKC
jgi:hypothetical protein